MSHKKHKSTVVKRDMFSAISGKFLNLSQSYELLLIVFFQQEIVKLTDEQVNERMSLIESKRQKLMKIKQMKGSRRQEKQNKQIQLAKQMMEQKLKKRMEQQGLLVFEDAGFACPWPQFNIIYVYFKIYVIKSNFLYISIYLLIKYKAA